MIDLDLSLGVSRATLRLESFVDCMLCPRPNIAKGTRLCGKCAVEHPRTPLRRWRFAMQKSLVEMEADTGLNKRTLLRADRGDRMSESVAKTLERYTKIPAAKFRGENEEP